MSKYQQIHDIKIQWLLFTIEQRHQWKYKTQNERGRERERRTRTKMILANIKKMREKKITIYTYRYVKTHTMKM